MLNEALTIASTLEAVRRGAPGAEIVVVDGGSIDASVATAAQPLSDILINAPRGRARQMNAGAHASHGDALVFVHADTIVPSTFAADIANALSDAAVVGGRFDVELDASALPYRIIGTMISLRSRISRHRHRRSGNLRAARRLRSAGRIPRIGAVRRSRVLAAAKAPRPDRMSACPRDNLRTAMEPRRRRAHCP